MLASPERGLCLWGRGGGWSCGVGLGAPGAPRDSGKSAGTAVAQHARPPVQKATAGQVQTRGRGVPGTGCEAGCPPAVGEVDQQTQHACWEPSHGPPSAPPKSGLWDSSRPAGLCRAAGRAVRRHIVLRKENLGPTSATRALCDFERIRVCSFVHSFFIYHVLGALQ